MSKFDDLEKMVTRELHEALTVACPRCGADPLEGCWWLIGDSKAICFHAERHEAATKLHQVVQ